MCEKGLQWLCDSLQKVFRLSVFINMALHLRGKGCSSGSGVNTAALLEKNTRRTNI